MSKRIILGVHVTNRVKNIAQVQKVLTTYGCNIKTRLGLHEVGEAYCAPNGLLIIETYGAQKKILELEKKLKKISGLAVRKMVF